MDERLTGSYSIARQLEQLRRDFDSAFARPWSAGLREASATLCFVAEGRRYAASLASLQQVTKAGTVVPLPSRSAGLLGLAVVQARVMPVFSLAGLAGEAAAATQPVWLAVLRGAQPAALALESLVGYPDPQSPAIQPEGPVTDYITGWVEHQRQLYAVLDCAALYQTITQKDSRKGPDPNA